MVFNILPEGLVGAVPVLETCLIWFRCHHPKVVFFISEANVPTQEAESDRLVYLCVG